MIGLSAISMFLPLFLILYFNIMLSYSPWVFATNFLRKKSESIQQA